MNSLNQKSKNSSICLSQKVNTLFQFYFGEQSTTYNVVKKLLPEKHRNIKFFSYYSFQPFLIDPDTEIGMIIIKAFSLFEGYIKKSDLVIPNLDKIILCLPKTLHKIEGNINEFIPKKDIYEYYTKYGKDIYIIPSRCISLFGECILENPLRIERFNRRKNFIYMVKHILSLKEDKPLLLKLCSIDLIVHIIAKYI